MNVTNFFYYDIFTNDFNITNSFINNEIIIDRFIPTLTLTKKLVYFFMFNEFNGLHSN